MILKVLYKLACWVLSIHTVIINYGTRLVNYFVSVCSGCYVDATDIRGNTPLHITALHGQELLLSVLLASGANHAR